MDLSYAVAFEFDGSPPITTRGNLRNFGGRFL